MTAELLIPFNKPYAAPKSLEYISEALESSHQQGGGPFNKKAANMVSKINGGGEVFLTGSCTQALEMATLLLDLKPGDEVIMPSYTFTSAATALVNYGVVPVFVDVESDHLNINPEKVRQAITSKTKAISIVNYAGYACDFKSLTEISNEFGLFKIEDNAHGFGAKSDGLQLGTWGDVSALSFHATKNIQCGEGGALIVNNPKFIERAHMLQEKGTNRRKFLEGRIEKYQWVDKGGSYLLAEINSAVLFAQIELYSKIQNERMLIQKLYAEVLSENIAEGNYSILNVNELDNQSAHMFALFPHENRSKILREFLLQNGVEANFHYQSLAESPFGNKVGKKVGSIAISKWASESILRLPLWYGLKSTEIEKIGELIKLFFQKK